MFFFRPARRKMSIKTFKEVKELQFLYETLPKPKTHLLGFIQMIGIKSKRTFGRCSVSTPLGGRW